MYVTMYDGEYILYISAEIPLPFCDWAYDSQTYLHKLHMFRNRYFYWSPFKINKFINYLLTNRFLNMAKKISLRIALDM